MKIQHSAHLGASLLALAMLVGIVDAAPDQSPGESGSARFCAIPGRLELRLNEYTASEQAHASLAIAEDGTVHVIWDSRRQRNGREGIYGRDLLPSGRLSPGEFVWLPTVERSGSGPRPSEAAYDRPAIVRDGSRLVSVWSSRGRDNAVAVSLQDLTPPRKGSPLQPLTPGSGKPDRGSSGRSAAKPSFGWARRNGPGVDDADRPVESAPVVVGLRDGGVFVLWCETSAGREERRIRGAGIGSGRVPGATLTLASGGGDHRLPTASPCGDGFVLAWDQIDPQGEILGVFARRFDADGRPLTPELAVSQGDDDAIEPAVAGFGDGRFVVGWMEYHEETDYDPMLRRFQADGSPLGAATLAPSGPEGWQSGIALDASSREELAVAWTNYRDSGDADVEVRLFTSDLRPLGPDLRATRCSTGRQTLSGAHGSRRIGWLPDGRLAVVWNGDGGQGDESGVYLSVFDPRSGTMDLASAAAPVAPPVYTPGQTPTDLDPEPFVVRGADLGFIGVTATGWSPPDPHMAVGPDHIVLCTNGAVSAKTKSGAAIFQEPLEGSQGFWGGLGAGGFVFDPEASYDVYEDRFYVMACERVGVSAGYLLFAVSSTGDPAQPWHKYRFNVTSPAQAWDIDSPNLAYDEDAIYLSADFFTPSDKYFVFIVDKPSVLGGGTAITNSYLRTGTQSFGIPEMYTPEAPRMYLIEHFDGGPRNEVRLWAIDDPFDTPSIQSATVAVPTYYLPGYLRSRGTSVQVYLFEGRFWSTMYRDGSLWACHHISESVPIESKARWYEFRMDGWPTSGNLPSLRQTGTIDPGAGIYAAFNSIAADAEGNAYMVFTRSSVDEYFSIGRTYRLASDPLGAMSPPATIKASTSSYSGDRWGDYSQVNADPVAPGTFWSHHEYSPGGGAWYTWVQSETISDPAATPLPVRSPSLPALTAFPNPASGPTHLRFSLAHRSELRAAVHDLSGRWIAGWNLGSVPPGPVETSWDTRDASGQAVPAGVYSVVVSGSGGRVAAGRITVTR